LRVLLVLGATAALVGLPAIIAAAIPDHPTTVATLRAPTGAVPARLLMVQAAVTNFQGNGLPKRVATVRVLGLSASAGNSGVLPYLVAADRPLAIVVIAYYTSKMAILLLAVTMAIFTKDENRRETCLQIMQAVSRGWWHWPTR
jgi:hypothetical protein